MPKKKDYKCMCGRDGWIDVGEAEENRYPCQLCFYKKYKRDSASAVIAMLEKEKF